MKYLNCANHIGQGGGTETLITLIDLSPSMNETDWKPTRKAGAVKANKELLKIKRKHHHNDRMGIIGFGGTAKILHDPVRVANACKSLQRSLDEAEGSCGTNFTAALKLAEACFFGKKVPSRAGKGFFSKMICELLFEPDQNVSKKTQPLPGLKRIIMLTDGEYNEGGSPIHVASRLKNAGVVLDCIGIGGSPNDVDEVILKKIASRNPDGSVRYCFIGDQEELIKKYETLAHHIRIA